MSYITGVTVWVPCGNRAICAETAETLYKVATLLQGCGISHCFRWIAASEIDMIRNLMVTHWYEMFKDSSHLLMLDSDMKVEPQMIWDMLQFDKEVVGTIYSRREFPPTAVGRVHTGLETTDDIIDGHLDVESVAGGVLLIRRDAIDRLLAHYGDDLWDHSMFHSASGALRQLKLDRLMRPFDKIRFPVGHHKHKKGGELSEDLSFCYRVRQAGGKVYANVVYPVGHVGPFNWSMCYGTFLAEQKAKLERGEKLVPLQEPSPEADAAAEIAIEKRQSLEEQAAEAASRAA